MAWFTYRVLNSGTSLGSLDLSHAVVDKADGIIYTQEPFNQDPDELGLEALNALDKLSFGYCYVVYSQQDVPEAQFAAWRWNVSNLQLEMLSGQPLQYLIAFRDAAVQMWSARRDWIRQAKIDILNEAWAYLTRPHRKVLLGADHTKLTEADWDLVGLGDAEYIEDVNLNWNQWTIVKGMFGF